jgi:hypothetical protein
MCLSRGPSLNSGRRRILCLGIQTVAPLPACLCVVRCAARPTPVVRRRPCLPAAAARRQSLARVRRFGELGERTSESEPATLRARVRREEGGGSAILGLRKWKWAAQPHWAIGGRGNRVRIRPICLYKYSDRCIFIFFIQTCICTIRIKFFVKKFGYSTEYHWIELGPPLSLKIEFQSGRGHWTPWAISKLATTSPWLSLLWFMSPFSTSSHIYKVLFGSSKKNKNKVGKWE